MKTKKFFLLKNKSFLRMSMKEMPQWEDGEEFLNSMTHGIAAMFAIIGTYFLFKKGRKSQNKVFLFSYIIYGISMIVLYGVSFIYHGLPDGSAKKFMRFVDHCSVFFLIAGSYTPVTLKTLKGRTGTIMCIAVWAISLTGMISKLFFFDLIYNYTVFIYVALGWVVVLGFKTIIKRMPKKGIMWLVLGGVLYTAGTYFYANDNIKFYHAIFHVFIALGTLTQFISIYYYA